MTRKTAEMLMERMEELNYEHAHSQSELAEAIGDFGNNLIGGLLMGVALLAQASEIAALKQQIQSFGDACAPLAKKTRLLILLAEEAESSSRLTFEQCVSVLVWNDWDRSEAEEAVNDLISLGILEKQQKALRLNHARNEKALLDLRHRLVEVFVPYIDWVGTIFVQAKRAEPEWLQLLRRCVEDHRSEHDCPISNWKRL